MLQSSGTGIQLCAHVNVDCACLRSDVQDLAHRVNYMLVPCITCYGVTSRCGNYARPLIVACVCMDLARITWIAVWRVACSWVFLLNLTGGSSLLFLGARVESVLVPGRLVFGRIHLAGLVDLVIWLSVRLDKPSGVVCLYLL
eukprot:6492574-Amphidinium_carterae.7